ncbi:MAG: TonB-dependent receptor [Prevotellaceae bacterium]|jgi:hypothetical protein|nr:TonB-dependent receptor [Prevotellaceae bacterium]
MKTKVLLLVWLCFCFNVCIFAQNGNDNPKNNKQGKVYGTVKDSESGSPLEFATAILLKRSDSTVVSSSIVDQNGLFMLNNIPSGDYTLKIAFIGYQDAEQDLQITVDNKDVDTKLTTLKPVNNELDAAVVTTKIPVIERKIDKLVMSVEGAVSTEGNNALDILKKAPGVTVDHDDNVKLLGSGVLVQIDGRNTYLSASDLATLLEGMDASEISKIEIVNSPSSKQEAAGSSGIINIRTRKSMMSGINGTANTGFTAAKHWGYNGGLSINYRNPWMGAFGSYNYRHYENFNNFEEIRRFLNNEPPSILHSISNNNFTSKRGNYRMGLDFYLNKKNMLGFLLTGNHGQFESKTYAPTTLININDNEALLKSLADNSNKERSTNISFNTNYRKLFEKEGQNLSVDFDYVKFKTRQNESRHDYFQFLTKGRDSTALVRTNSPRNVEVFSGKADYMQPLGTTMQLEVGAKISYSKTKNDLDWENNFGGIWEPDAKRSNKFEYNERVTAAHASIAKQFSEKFSTKLGLRWENTWSNGYTPATGIEKIRKYDDFFPTVFVQYKLSKDHDLSFTYNRRIRRPDYDDLNPFRIYVGTFTYIAGNADLKPQYTNNLNLTYGFKNAVITTLLYQRQSDLIVQTPEQSEEVGESGVIQDNFGYNDMLGVSVSIPSLPLTKWWILSANLWGMWSHSHSKQNDIVYDQYSLMAQGYMSNTFTIAKTWRAEVSANATSPASWGYFKIKAQYWGAIGVKKSFFDNKLNLSLNFDDPFEWSKNSMDVKYGKSDYHYETRWMSRRVRVSLVWRFGSTKIKPIQDRKGGNEDELSRLKSQ